MGLKPRTRSAPSATDGDVLRLALAHLVAPPSDAAAATRGLRSWLCRQVPAADQFRALDLVDGYLARLAGRPVELAALLGAAVPALPVLLRRSFVRWQRENALEYQSTVVYRPARARAADTTSVAREEERTIETFTRPRRIADAGRLAGAAIERLSTRDARLLEALVMDEDVPAVGERLGIARAEAYDSARSVLGSVSEAVRPHVDSWATPGNNKAALRVLREYFISRRAGAPR